MWHADFFNDLYWQLFMKRSPERILNEALLLKDIAGMQAHHNVLDVCCGVADIAQQLSIHTQSISGIEYSNDYVATAKVLAPDVHMYAGDVFNIKNNEQYDVVYNWYSSFAYFEHEKNIELLQRCYNWTVQDGVFVLETYNSANVINNFIALRTYDMVHNGKMYHIERHSTINGNKLHQLWKIFDNNICISEHNTFTILYLQSQLQQMLQDVGFTNITMYAHDSMHLSPYNDNCQRLLLKAYK